MLKAICVDNEDSALKLGHCYDVRAGYDIAADGGPPIYGLVYLHGPCPGPWMVSRFKFRVKAVSRPTPEPELYHELRTAHGPSRYQTGKEVFRGWNPLGRVLSVLSDTGRFAQ